MAGVIAEWAVEATISNLVATAYNFIAEHSGMLDQWQQGIMEKELSQLRNQQLQIQSCLSAIEKGPITMDGMDPSLRAWLWQLRDAIDAADNLLDDIEYRRVEGRGKQEGVKVPSTSQSPTKYVKMMFKDIFGTDPLSKRLSEVVNQLNDVTSNINVIIQLALNIKLDAERMHLELARSRVTGPIQTERKFVGREKEREELKGWLLNSKLNCESDAGISPTSVLTMVGLGGVGKTTLVQEVYNDPEVREFFTRMIWVCVSNDFEPPQVLYKIMECAYGGIIISKENFSMIQEILQTKLISEKFLIVLDDVWEDVHFDRWEKLVAPLRYGQMGSKILVTTRMNSVAIMVKRVMGEATYRQIDLKSLHYQEFLPLFNRYAFSGVKIDNYKDLELLGQQFAKKLGGVPLLAKVIGGLLNSSLDHVQWKMILETDVMDFENGEKKVLVQLPPLGQLSFLKFLYLSGLPALEKIGLEFYGEDGCGIFPALEKMDMECLAKCTEWFGVENANILDQILANDASVQKIAYT
ncbi:hypothetical protein LUZ60_016599 [Juncus effusus]|nr:hypothetical protein LUZ60_016599 [Juncus effusus]